MKNEILQEQYEKVFKTLHETRRTQTRELVAPVDINHHLGAPQHGGSPPFDIGIPDEERANHQNIDQHETSLNPDTSTEVGEVEKDTSLQRGWKDRKPFLVTAETF
ncbi:hypothetical protein ACFX15_031268 [Malus domestica]